MLVGSVSLLWSQEQAWNCDGNNCDGNTLILAQGWDQAARWHGDGEKALNGGSNHRFWKNLNSGAPQGMELEWFGGRKAAAWQKPLPRADTAQRGGKGKFFPGSPRRPCRICCEPGKHREVDGVRLNLKARRCPARTMRFVTNPFHRSPVSFSAFSGLISSWH